MIDSRELYKSIPVDVARRIGQDFAKSMVLLIAYDPAFDRTHAVSWGASPEEKERAAHLVDECLTAIGIDTSTQTTHEDYRHSDAGERAAVVDALLLAGRAADKALAAVIDARPIASPAYLAAVRQQLQAAITQATTMEA